MGSTDYFDTFIRVADDCPVTAAETPAPGANGPTIASLQYELVSQRPYELTSDDVLFEVHRIRQCVPDELRAEARKAFFAKSRACLRSSPLGKRYGWGIHCDAEGRVALVPVQSERYRALAADEALTQTRAMRSKRA